MSTDVKFSKAQLSKMIQSGGFVRNMLGNLGKKAPTNVAMPLARDSLAQISKQFNFRCSK